MFTKPYITVIYFFIGVKIGCQVKIPIWKLKRLYKKFCRKLTLVTSEMLTQVENCLFNSRIHF